MGNVVCVSKSLNTRLYAVCLFPLITYALRLAAASLGTFVLLWVRPT